jgi:hypothetical protein
MTMFGEDESQLIIDLTGGFTDDLTGFYNTNMSDFQSFNNAAPLYAFSGGTRVGTVFAATPEPCSMAALAMGCIALARRRKKA